MKATSARREVFDVVAPEPGIPGQSADPRVGRLLLDRCAEHPDEALLPRRSYAIVACREAVRQSIPGQRRHPLYLRADTPTGANEGRRSTSVL